MCPLFMSIAQLTLYSFDAGINYDHILLNMVLTKAGWMFKLKFRCVSGRILDYVIEPVPIELPLMYADKTKLVHVAAGRAHTIVVTDKEGSKYSIRLQDGHTP